MAPLHTAPNNPHAQPNLPDTTSVAHALSQIGYPLLAEQAAQLATYLEWLLRWNKVMNLVGVRTWHEAVRTLIIDSLELGPFLDALPLPQAPICWDPGAGAGLPGIPLRTVWQRGTYWMIEPREKRALFLSNVLAHMPLPHTHVFRGRLEQFTTAPVGQVRADVLVSKAFMPWRALLDTARPCLAPGGLVVLLLNEAPTDAELAAPINSTRWRVVMRHSYTLPSSAPRSTKNALAATDVSAMTHTLLAVSPSEY